MPTTARSPRKTAAPKKTTRPSVGKPAPAAGSSRKRAPQKPKAKSTSGPRPTRKSPAKKPGWTDAVFGALDKANPLLGTVARTVASTAKSNPKLATSIAAGAVSIAAGVLAGKIRSGVDADKVAARTLEAADSLAEQAEKVGEVLADFLRRMSK